MTDNPIPVGTPIMSARCLSRGLSLEVVVAELVVMEEVVVETPSVTVWLGVAGVG